VIAIGLAAVILLGNGAPKATEVQAPAPTPENCREIYGGTGGAHPIRRHCSGPLVVPDAKLAAIVASRAQCNGRAVVLRPSRPGTHPDDYDCARPKPH
jgi:hypothetical protein